MTPLKLKSLIIILLLATALPEAIVAQKTTRKPLKLEKDAIPVVEAEHNDTVVSAPGDIILSGYEKAQSSTKETVFITNKTDREIMSVKVDIEYTDLKGRQLTRRVVDITLTDPLPPDETRQANFPSWDTQRLWYYAKSQGKYNDYATPYLVSVDVRSYVVKSEEVIVKK